jgi:hypothetical protein
VNLLPVPVSVPLPHEMLQLIVQPDGMITSLAKPIVNDFGQSSALNTANSVGPAEYCPGGKVVVTSVIPDVIEVSNVFGAAKLIVVGVVVTVLQPVRLTSHVSDRVSLPVGTPVEFRNVLMLGVISLPVPTFLVVVVPTFHVYETPSGIELPLVTGSALNLKVFVVSLVPT